MSFSPEEDDFIYAALLRHVVNSGSSMLAVTTPINDMTITGKINFGAPAQFVRQAITLCIADGNRLNPPAVIRLLNIVAMVEPRIGPVIARLRVQVALNLESDLFSDVVLAWKIPFLERRRLRQTLKSLLAEKPTQPFVVVNGSQNQGKSYTTEFISHVLHDVRNVAPCIVHLKENQGAAVGPSELARDLVARLGGTLSTEPPKVTNLERWYDELVNWVTEAGQRTENVWWIVLDGFNANELRSDTRDFIGQLAARLTSGMPQFKFRLILLDFDRTHLPVMGGKVAKDNTDPITHANVESFIGELFAEAAQPIDVKAVTAGITYDLGDPVIDLTVLNERLTGLIEVAEAGQ